LVARYANSFDLKDWDALRACLADAVHADYSALRGTPAETMAAEHFVETRRAALNDLRTQHLAANVEVALSGDSGEARASMAIFRRNQDGGIFHTHCLYRFGVLRGAQGWRIGSIVQSVFMNSGDPRIHPGIGGSAPGR